jgi:hypothetical protein
MLPSLFPQNGSHEDYRCDKIDIDILATYASQVKLFLQSASHKKNTSDPNVSDNDILAYFVAQVFRCMPVTARRSMGAKLFWSFMNETYTTASVGTNTDDSQTLIDKLMYSLNLCAVSNMVACANSQYLSDTCLFEWDTTISTRSGYLSWCERVH